MNRELFRSHAASIGLRLRESQLDAFCSFEEALYSANQVKNLTRIPREQAWSLHFLDSLLFQDLIPEGAAVLDIGCGPGFPAWPLAIARPDLLVTAMDSNGKALAFLREHPLRNLKIVQARAEEWTETEAFDWVTGRAVAPLASQLEISAAFCRLQGSVGPLRTSKDLEAAQRFNTSILGLRFECAHERQLPGTDAMRCCPVYEKVSKTPARFPRRWAEIRSNPLSAG